MTLRPWNMDHRRVLAMAAEERGLVVVHGLDAIKMVAGLGAGDLIEGLGIPFGSEFDKDRHGEFFTPRTELGDIVGRPLWFQHGKDQQVGNEPVGWVKSAERFDSGIWVKAQLDVSSRYFKMLKDQINRGALYFSSSAVPSLVSTSKSGEICKWPVNEMSLVTRPAGRLAPVELAAKSVPWMY